MAANFKVSDYVKGPTSRGHNISDLIIPDEHLLALCQKGIYVNMNQVTQTLKWLWLSQFFTDAIWYVFYYYIIMLRLKPNHYNRSTRNQTKLTTIMLLTLSYRCFGNKFIYMPSLLLLTIHDAKKNIIGLVIWNWSVSEGLNIRDKMFLVCIICTWLANAL